MVEWQSPDVQGFCLFLFMHMTVFVLGGFLWYIVLTWPIVEGALFARKLKFSPSHVPYLLSRYLHLFALVMLAIVFNTPTPATMTCSSINFSRFNSVIGNIALFAASMNLGVRAYTLWCGNWWVRGAMLFVGLGHLVYAIAVGSMGINARWNADHTQCLVIPVQMKFELLGFYVYTMSWDVFVMLLTITGMRRQGLPKDSPLSSALTRQGITYACIACSMCIPMTVMVALDLNQIMNIFFSIPCCSISVVASSAAVISLLKLKDKDRDAAISVSEKSAAVNESSFNPLTTNIDLSMFCDSSHMETGSEKGGDASAPANRVAGDIERGAHSAKP